jgi:hypothetical protein
MLQVRLTGPELLDIALGGVVVDVVLLFSYLTNPAREM